MSQEAAAWLILFNRAAMRDLRREAVFLCIIPLRAAWSNRLAAWVTADAASSVSPDSMERSALLTPVRVALRMARLRWARFTDCRAAFLAGKFTSGWIPWLLGIRSLPL